jgi:hypothetical protein
MSISGDGDDYSNFDESEKDFNEAQEEVDFYAILNIPRNVCRSFY